MPEFVTDGICTYSNRREHHYPVTLGVIRKLCIMTGNHVSKLLQNFMHILTLAEQK